MRLFLGLSVIILAVAVARADDGDAEQVRRLVSRLSSPDFREREIATAALDRLGEKALDPLRQAAATGDAETRRRATALVDSIGRRLATDRILAPTLVTLNYNRIPLAEAVADLSRRTGLPITLHGDAAKIEGRTVSVFADRVSAWRAMQLFCNRAGMHEWDGLSALPASMALPPIISYRMIPAPSTEGILVLGQMNVRRGQVNALTVPSPSPSPRVALIDGPGPALPAHYAGSVRVRAAPPGTSFNAETGKDTLLVLQVSADARLHIDGASDLRIERAIDDEGRNRIGKPIWSDPTDDREDLPRGMRLPPQITERKHGPVAIRFARDEVAPRKLRELAGVVTVQAFAPEPIVEIARPAEAVNRTVRHENVTLTLTSYNPNFDGGVRVVADVQLPYGTRLESPVSGPIGLAGRGGRFWNNFAMDLSEPSAVTGDEYQGLAVFDADGRALPAASGDTSITGLFPEWYIVRITGRYQSTTAAPARITFAARRPTTVEVPFILRDVPLR